MPTIWTAFTPVERRNIMIYIAGIMCYKLGLEAFNGSIVTLATDRFGPGTTFTKLAILTGLNQAMQVVGSILIAPLIKAFPTRSVLASAILVFGFMTTLFLIIDAATGGVMKQNNGGVVRYGRWSPDVLFPLYSVAGISYGMVELIRRVIPRDIVGGNVQKLRRMDAMVHILYEVAGTAGAFLSVALIQQFGNNYSFFITPILFAMAAIAWSFIDDLGHGKILNAANLKDVDAAPAKKKYGLMILKGFKAFGRSTYKGAFICFSHRRFVWLVSSYSLALYGHRYLENGIAPAIARRIMQNSSFSQIMVGGSNAGELLGAASVLLLTNHIKTPIPFLRFDALALLLVWALPALTTGIPTNNINYAWRIAGLFVPISFGWAAGDVSLAAFIQASLARMESEDEEVSALGAVMAFLFSTYIIIYAVLGSLLGTYIDGVFAADGNIFRALTSIAGIQFTVICVVILLSTLIPKGAIALNPEIISDAILDSDLESSQPTESRSDEGAEVDEKDEMKSRNDIGAML